MQQKKILVLGAGTAGTIIVNRLVKGREKYGVTIIDRDDRHLYQPGLLFVPFGKYDPSEIVKSRREQVSPHAEFILAEVDRIDTATSSVILKSGDRIAYDLLVIATGSRIVPEETAGLMGTGWQQDIFDFYTFDGAVALRDHLRTWPGGKLVVHVKEMPIKCPVAPLEFSFLADAFFKEKEMREKVEITYVTPLSGAFTKPIASEKLGAMMKDRGIRVVPDFDVESVDPVRRELKSYDGRQVPYDLLVTIPTHMGDPIIERSGLGDELGFVPTHPRTLQSKAAPNVFVLGDATNIAASKAGSVAHFEAEVLPENIRRYFAGQPLLESFDGHSNCFIESGGGKGVLIDFNAEIEPLPGRFPLAHLGPLKLLKETRLNHWGKLAFRWVYWHRLLPGRSIPFVKPTLSLKGKEKSA